MSKKLTLHPIWSWKFLGLFIAYSVAATLLNMGIAWAVSYWAPGVAEAMVRRTLVVAIITGWLGARSLRHAFETPAAPVCPPISPQKLFFYRELGYIYGPYPLDEIRARVANPKGIEVAEWNGESQRELKEAAWIPL